MLKAFRRKRFLFPPDRNFIVQLRRILGYTPRKLKLYQLALIHKSAAGQFSREHDIHNERLEFLGDAILDSIIAEHLYSVYPQKDEGFLTQLRSKIVNRETLKRIALDLGLGELLISKMTQDNYKAIYGDALEALIGAIYLDRGYTVTRRFVVNRIIKVRIDLEELAEQEVDFKSRIIEWGQKNRKDINFSCHEQLDADEKTPVFVSHLLVFDDIVGMGVGKSKKEAEQNAARQAIQMIGL